MNKNKPKKKDCFHCGKEYLSQSNNSKFCSKWCRNKKRILSGYNRLYLQRYSDKKRKHVKDGFECPLCGLYYKALLTHVWQRHDMSAKEFKEEFIFAYKKSFILNDNKEAKRIGALKTVDNNLLEGGKATRYKKNDPRTKINTYERLGKKRYYRGL